MRSHACSRIVFQDSKESWRASRRCSFRTGHSRGGGPFYDALLLVVKAKLRERLNFLEVVKQMAGEAARLFLRPTPCCLSGLYLEARKAYEGRARLYAAVYFNTMTSVVPDDLNYCWICRRCTCHISLTRIADMPNYDARSVSDLHNVMKRWQKSHDSVLATLHYMGGVNFDEDDRIILRIVPGGDASLSDLLDELHNILDVHAPTDYHVSVTDPGHVHWFKCEPSRTPACPAAASSLESSSSHGTSLALSVCSGSMSTSSNRSRASSARSADPRIRELESVARVTSVFCMSRWRCWCPEEPRCWRPLTALMPSWEL